MAARDKRHLGQETLARTQRAMLLLPLMRERTASQEVAICQQRFGPGVQAMCHYLCLARLRVYRDDRLAPERELTAEDVLREANGVFHLAILGFPKRRGIPFEQTEGAMWIGQRPD